MGSGPDLRSLTDPEHPCGADRAYALGGRAAVLHRNGLWVAHLSLGPALHTIRFHGLPPILQLYVSSYNMTRCESAIAPSVAGIEPCVSTILDLVQNFDFELFSKPVLLMLRRSTSGLALIDIGRIPRVKIEPVVHGLFLFLFLALASSTSGPQASAPVLGRSRFCSDTLASPVHMCLLFPLSDKLSDGPPFNSPTRSLRRPAPNTSPLCSTTPFTTRP